jgi:hypothetical protein
MFDGVDAERRGLVRVLLINAGARPPPVGADQPVRARGLRDGRVADDGAQRAREPSGGGRFGRRAGDRFAEVYVEIPPEVAGQRGHGAADGCGPVPVVVILVPDVDRPHRHREQPGEGRGQPPPIQLTDDQKAVTHGSYVPSWLEASPGVEPVIFPALQAGRSAGNVARP